MKSLKLVIVAIMIFFTSNCCKSQQVEFQYIKNQLVIPVFIEGKGPYKMLLDTGVDPSVIDLGLTKYLGMHVDSTNFGKAEGRGTDVIKVYPVKINELSISDKNNYGIDALAMNLGHLGEPLGVNLNGILGYSFLKDKIFKIDYQKHLLEFYNSRSELEASFKGEKYIIHFFYDGEDRIPLINKLLVNGLEFTGSVDTGSSLNIQIYDHFLDTYKINIDSTKVSRIIGARGNKKTFRSNIESFKIGGFVFSNQEVTISSIKNEDQLRSGNIGNRFLQNFYVGFDYTNNELIFEKIGSTN